MLRGPLTQIRPGTDACNTHFAHVALHTLAIDRRKILFQKHGQFPRAIKRMRGIQLVDAVLNRHFLRRWHSGLIVETAPAQTEQVGLDCEWQGIGGVINQHAALHMAQDGNLFFRKLTWVVSRPISAYSSSSCLAWAAWASVSESRFSKTVGSSLTA